MTDLLAILDRFQTGLTQTAPKIASSLQTGLTRAEIEAQIASLQCTVRRITFSRTQSRIYSNMAELQS